MIVLLIIFYFFIVLCTYLEEYIEKYRIGVYFLFGILLILIAGLRIPGHDHDSYNYLYVYANDGVLENFVGMEPTYVWLCKLVRILFNNFQFLLLIYAFLGVFFKLKAIKYLSPQVFFLPLLVYFSNYFLLHEMTQIRAGVASGIFLFALKPLIQGKRWTYIGYILVALFFHYSSLVLFPFVFLTNRDMSKKERYILLLVLLICFSIALLHINIFIQIPIPALQEKIEIYQQLSAKGFDTYANVFNLHFLIRLFVFLFSMFFYRYIKTSNEYMPILLRLMAFSIFYFLLFSSLSVLAFRISELIGIVDILIFSSLIYAITPRYAAKTVVFIFTSIILGLNLFYSPLIFSN